MKRLALISSLCLTALSFCACDDDSSDKSSKTTDTSCVEATHVPSCTNDLSAVVRCKNGELVAEKCTGGVQCVPSTAACATTSSGTGTDQPGTDQPGTDPGTDQPSTPGNECDAATYPTYCNGTSKLVTCENGHIVTTPCGSGTECDATQKSCVKSSGTSQNNTVGAKCNPATFSESCYASGGTNSAVICDEDTLTVKRIPCTDYGDDYKFCDIATNFYGDGRNIVICSTPKDECNVGDSYSLCEDDSYYDDTLAEGEQYSEATYVCEQFEIYRHYYLSEERACAKHCKDKTACYEYKD